MSALCRPLFLLLYQQLFLLPLLLLPSESALGLTGLCSIALYLSGFLWQNPPLPKKYQRQYYPKPRWKKKIVAYCHKLMIAIRSCYHFALIKFITRGGDERRPARQTWRKRKPRRDSLNLHYDRTSHIPYALIRRKCVRCIIRVRTVTPRTPLHARPTTMSTTHETCTCPIGDTDSSLLLVDSGYHRITWATSLLY